MNNLLVSAKFSEIHYEESKSVAEFLFQRKSYERYFVILRKSSQSFLKCYSQGTYVESSAISSVDKTS